MIYFKQTALHRIMSASDEEEVENVIDDSIQRLKSRNVNGHIIQRFILAMDKILYQAKLEAESDKVQQNMDIAIGLFRSLQRP